MMKPREFCDYAIGVVAGAALVWFCFSGGRIILNKIDPQKTPEPQTDWITNNHWSFDPNSITITNRRSVSVTWSREGAQFEDYEKGYWLWIPFPDVTNLAYTNIVIESKVQPIVNESNGLWVITFK